ncbi:MAG: hypothetical protein RLZZ364_976 [Actinomycetota bacterium]|jgi:hypothetical protein
MRLRFLAALLITTLATQISLGYLAEATASNPYGATEVDPAGPNEIILTITNGSQKVEFPYPRLARFKGEKITIYEPFVKKRQTFTVIEISKLFAMAHIAKKDYISTIALNDYVFKAAAAEFLAAGALIAIKVNGNPIGYDQGGPIRLIYPPKSKWAKNLDAWNWSLAEIKVEP